MNCKREYLKLKKRVKRTIRRIKKTPYNSKMHERHLKRISLKYYRIRADYRYIKVRIKHYRNSVKRKTMMDYYKKSNAYRLRFKKQQGR